MKRLAPFLGLVILVACPSTSSSPQTGSFAILPLVSGRAIAVAEGSIRYDPIKLEYIGVGSSDGTTLVVGNAGTAGGVHLSAAAPAPRSGEFALAVFKLKATDAMPAWVSSQGFLQDGSPVELDARSTVRFSSTNPIAGQDTRTPSGVMPAAVPVTGSPVAAWANFRLGDVDKSGSVTSSDTTLVTNISGGTTATDEQKYLADIDGNGVVNAIDVLICQQLVTGTTLDATVSIAPETVFLEGAGSATILVGNAGQVALPAVVTSTPPGVALTLVSTSSVGTQVWTASSNKVIPGGTIKFIAGNAASQVVRIWANPGGAPDEAFNGTGRVTTDFGSSFDYALALAINSSGKTALAGRTYNGANEDFAVAQYTSTGALDTTFDTDGKLTTALGTSDDVAQAAAYQSDGKLLVAGRSFNGTNDDFALVRYNTNGSLDTSFGSGGKVITNLGGNDVVQALAIQTDGKIVVAGFTRTGATVADFGLARYTTGGLLDTSFGSAGTVVTSLAAGEDAAAALAIQSDGKIVAAGYADNGADHDVALARYTTSGALDGSFDADGKLTIAIGGASDEANAVAVQADGKIVAAGHADVGGGDYDFALLRVTASGALDTSFDTDGKVTSGFYALSYDEVFGLAIQSNGRIVAAGVTDNGVNDFALARFNTNGTLDVTFELDGLLSVPVSPGEDAANAIAIEPGTGRIVAAGYARSGVNDNFAAIKVFQ